MQPAVRWAVVAVCVLGLVVMLGWARNNPGVGGRFPHPEDVRSSPTTQP